MWELYKKQPGFVLGFHGCDAAVGEAVLAGKTRHLKPSNNPYDWLGNGIYFWDGSPERALQFATEAATSKPKVSAGKIKKPFVLGAVIDLGLCCNLMDIDALGELERAHQFLEEFSAIADEEMPVNRGPERAVRFLDKAVIEMMHSLRAHSAPGGTALPAYDTVRAAFFEGGELYPGAGFSKKAHIQIAVRNPECIRGYFRPLVKYA